MPSQDRRSILIYFFLAALVLIALPVKTDASNRKRVVVRNDLVPLALDFEKGRFGSGKLYFDDPIDLAVDEDDNVYILDAGNYRIQVMDDRGRFADQWGSRGEQDGFFDEPVALTINPDSDFLVVVDQGSPRIHKFELDGEFVLSFGEEGTRKGKLKEPVDVTIDTLDYVYIVDRDRKVVLKYHKSGSFVKEWGDSGKQDERLSDPVSIAYSDELTGYIYVLDTGRMALFKYERDGGLEEIIYLVPDVFEKGIKPVKVEINDENEVFVLDGLQGKLIRLYRDEISVFQVTSDEMPIDHPAGMAIDDKNSIYISDLRKNRIFRFQMELD